jgi:hypothetical protein
VGYVPFGSANVLPEKFEASFYRKKIEKKSRRPGGKSVQRPLHADFHPLNPSQGLKCQKPWLEGHRVGKAVLLP